MVKGFIQHVLRCVDRTLKTGVIFQIEIVYGSFNIKYQKQGLAHCIP